MKNCTRVCVIGSINMDLVTKLNRIPNKGETMLGESFFMCPGGKGANQATAASKLGGSVTMIGSIGRDAFGDEALKQLKKNNINCENIAVQSNTSTGVATILLDNNDNRIIVTQGANEYVSIQMIKNSLNSILSNDIILVQLEIPMKTVEFIVDVAYESKIPVILNPAPFANLSENVLEKVTFLTPNETELNSIKKLQGFHNIKSKLIVTKGNKGVEYTNCSSEEIHVPAEKVNVVDTTGAGDTFNGAFAVEFARTKKIDKSVQFANMASALSITKKGAQQGIPQREEVLHFLKSKACSIL